MRAIAPSKRLYSVPEAAVYLGLTVDGVRYFSKLIAPSRISLGPEPNEEVEVVIIS
jgi:hypothetical protein